MDTHCGPRLDACKNNLGCMCRPHLPGSGILPADPYLCAPPLPPSALRILQEPPTAAADVYAWAVTVNELATGTFPFSDCTKDNPACHTVLEMGYALCRRPFPYARPYRRDQRPPALTPTAASSDCMPRCARSYGQAELAAAVASEGLRPLLRPDTPPTLANLLEACWMLDPAERPSMEEVLQVRVPAPAPAACWRAAAAREQLVRVQMLFTSRVTCNTASMIHGSCLHVRAHHIRKETIQHMAIYLLFIL